MWLLKKNIKLIAAIVAFLLSVPATAEYVSADVLNCRSDPNKSGLVIAKIERGKQVEVDKTSGAWSKLASPNCWVLTRYLSSNFVALSRPNYRASEFRPSSRKRSNKRSKRPSGNNYGSSCPCSGNNICIGPRGGRYCITSGGNKRYGV